MEEEDIFKDYKNRLNLLKKPIRESALKHAKIFLEKGNITKEEALEKGIAKAEMEQRNL